jgi:hypothetical protein
MSTTISFKIRTIKHQIQACLQAIKNGLKSFVDRLCVLEAKLEAMMTTQTEPKTEPKYIELNSNRSKGINAYLVQEGSGYQHNDYGTPIDDENQQRAYRKKSHVVKVRIDNLADGIYRFVEAAGQYAHKIEKGWLKIINGQIVQQSDTLPSLVVGTDAESLPELKGSDKQIDWAFSIREKAIAKLKLQQKPIPDWFFTEKSAKIWIDKRDEI